MKGKPGDWFAFFYRIIPVAISMFRFKVRQKGEETIFSKRHIKPMQSLCPPDW